MICEESSSSQSCPVSRALNESFNVFTIAFTWMEGCSKHIEDFYSKQMVTVNMKRFHAVNRNLQQTLRGFIQ